MKIINILQQNLKLIIKTWLKCMGVFSGLLSFFFLFWTWDDLGITSTQWKCSIIVAICAVALIISIVWVCIFKRSKTVWESASGKVKVCYADIIKESFKKRNKKEKLFVIPVNSCFDTIVDANISICSVPLVSPNSLHGKWIEVMLKNGYSIESLDDEIDQSLELQEIYPYKILSGEEKERGKRKAYGLGTVAMVRGKNHSTFLLLAMSEFDENNMAYTSVDELVKSIKSLTDFYNRHGQGHQLFIPLMGTNLSRTGLSHNDSLRVLTSLLQIYGDKIHGEVDVIIYKGDKDKVSLGM